MQIPKLRLFLVMLLAVAVITGWLGILTVPFKDVFAGLGAEDKVADSSVVDTYRADFRLEPDGRLAITEQLDVAFTTYDRHGIYRIFDTQDAQYASIEHPVDVVSVERKQNGEWQPEPYTVSQEGGGTKTIRVGSPDVTFGLGVQKYRIVSTTSNALTEPRDGPAAAQSQWYWDVVGSGWSMPMRQVEVTASIPTTVAPPICEASVPCKITDEGGAYRISMSDLPSYTPVTMKAFFAQPAPGVQRSIWQYLLVFAGLAFVGLSLWLTLRTFSRSRERAPNVSPQFQPPGPDPLMAAWTLGESPAKRGVPAVLLNLVAQEVLAFQTEQRSVQDDKGPDWIQLTRTNAPVPDVVGFQSALGRLGLIQPGSSVVISKKSVSDGKLLSALNTEISNEIGDRAIRDGFASRVGGSGTALFLIYAAIVGGFTALIWLDLGVAIATLLLLAAAVGLVINRRDTTLRSEAGARLRDGTAGFKQVLSTSASIERFDYSARVRHFDDYLPWAVALDCAEEWAASCTPPPGSPESSTMAGTSYLYNSPTRTSPLWALSTGVVAVEASAVAAYHASQSSSSSGGGGGGGGGSGGGGGGSW